MLKKIILGIVIGAIVLTTSAGFVYAYQKESGGRQNYSRQSNLTSKNDGACTNQNCINNGAGQNCTNAYDCENCQNLQNCQNNQNTQGLRNGQNNSKNCTGACLNNNNSISNENGNGNLYRYKNQNNNCSEFNMQDMLKNKFKNN